MRFTRFCSIQVPQPRPERKGRRLRNGRKLRHVRSKRRKLAAGQRRVGICFERPKGFSVLHPAIGFETKYRLGIGTFLACPRKNDSWLDL
ncbi:hypothetical protein R6Z07F_009724 [Ovis aries]|nr:DNA-directed RNA polymerases I, II, and III subunit RPABC4 isoform X2 [Ovis aries]